LIKLISNEPPGVKGIPLVIEPSLRSPRIKVTEAVDILIKAAYNLFGLTGRTSRKVFLGIGKTLFEHLLKLVIGDGRDWFVIIVK